LVIKKREKRAVGTRNNYFNEIKHEEKNLTFNKLEKRNKKTPEGVSMMRLTNKKYFSTTEQVFFRQPFLNFLQSFPVASRCFKGGNAGPSMTCTFNLTKQ
jgi:hypothetical protein